MTIKVDQHWPLTVIKPIRENALWKETVSNVPSQNIKEPANRENLSDRRTGSLWKKGTFVDVYI